MLLAFLEHWVPVMCCFFLSLFVFTFQKGDNQNIIIDLNPSGDTQYHWRSLPSDSPLQKFSVQMFQNPDGLWILYHPERKKMCMKVEHWKEKKQFSIGDVMATYGAQGKASFPKAS